MATALEVITGSLKLLGIRVAESAVEDNEAQDGLESLNDMMSEWDTDGITIGFERVADVSDELYVDDGALGAIKSNLAIYLAPEYSRIITDALALRARSSKNSLRASVPLSGSDFPDTLPVGVGNEHVYTGDGDSPGNFTGGRFYPKNVNSKCS